MRWWERNKPNRIFFVTGCIALIFNAALSAQRIDSVDVHRTPPRIPPGKKAVSVFLAPTLLVGAGIATVEDRGWYSSYDAYACIQKNFPDFHAPVENVLMFLPAAAVYGLNWAGVKGKNGLAERSVMFLSSLTLSIVSSSFIKNKADILRPDGSNTQSMPSNHTVLAFVSATFLHEEYKHKSPWIGVAGYAVATATGLLRMMNNEHWMSDVLVGAGLGILMTKTVYWVYPLIKEGVNHRPVKKGKQTLSLAPYLAPDHYGLYLRYAFR